MRKKTQKPGGDGKDCKENDQEGDRDQLLLKVWQIRLEFQRCRSCRSRDEVTKTEK